MRGEIGARKHTSERPCKRQNRKKKHRLTQRTNTQVREALGKPKLNSQAQVKTAAISLAQVGKAVPQKRNTQVRKHTQIHKLSKWPRIH